MHVSCMSEVRYNFLLGTVHAYELRLLYHSISYIQCYSESIRDAYKRV